MITSVLDFRELNWFSDVLRVDIVVADLLISIEGVIFRARAVRDRDGLLF